MADYLKSLEKLLPYGDAQFFPGHGGRITQTRRVLRSYLMHRQLREAAILGCIKQGMGDIEEIVRKVYGTSKTDSTASFAAAAASVYAHVVYLFERGYVSPVAGVAAPDAFYVPVPPCAP